MYQTVIRGHKVPTLCQVPIEVKLLVLHFFFFVFVFYAFKGILVVVPLPHYLTSVVDEEVILKICVVCASLHH
jgi:hypothetical protein